MAIQKKKNRIIKVDGILYSLDTGRPVQAASQSKTESQVVKPKPKPSPGQQPIRGFDIVKVAKPKPTPPVVVEEEPILPQKPVKTKPPEQAKEVSYQEQASQTLSRHPHAVSHPSLPIDTAHAIKKPDNWFVAVFLQTIVKKTDSKIARVSFMQAFFSPLSWFILALPLILGAAVSLRYVSLSSLLMRLRQSINPDNYWIAVWLIVVIGVGLALLCVLTTILGYSVLAMKIRLLDNRPVKLSAIIRRNLAHIDRIFLNWSSDQVLMKAVFIAVAYFSFVTITSANAMISVGRTPLVAVIIAIGLGALMIIQLARPFQRVLLATIDEKLSYVRPKSYSILFKNNFWRNVLAGFSALLVNLILLGLAVAVVWAQYTYLATAQSTTMQVGLVIGGIVLVMIILSVRLAWLQSFWSAHYHFTLTTSRDGHLSALLNQETPPKLKPWPIVRLVLVIIVLVGLFLFAAFRYEKTIQQNLQRLERAIPSDFTQLIPKNN